jgi:pimeloyl-ACP methyl ester carboxylesterase
MTTQANLIADATRTSGNSEDCSLVLADGRKMSYAEYGATEGLPVFGFHGTPGSRFMFRLVHEPAKRIGLRIIAPERPGFGRSTYQHGRSIGDWAKDVEALANYLGLDRFGVAGISGGGPYAAACAALLPKRVIAAGLVSPMGPVCLPKEASRFESVQGAAFRRLPYFTPALHGAFSGGRFMFLNAPNYMYRFLIARAGPADRNILSSAAIRQNLLDGVAEGLRPGVRGSIHEMKLFGQDWSLPLQAIEAPVVLWQGTADRNVPVASALYLSEQIPNCELLLLEGAGHYWIFEHVEEVLQTIKQRMMGAPPR